MREPTKIEEVLVPVVDRIAPMVNSTPPAGPRKREAADASGVALVANSGKGPIATTWIRRYSNTTRVTPLIRAKGSGRRGRITSSLGTDALSQPPNAKTTNRQACCKERGAGGLVNEKLRVARKNRPAKQNTSKGISFPAVRMLMVHTPCRIPRQLMAASTAMSTVTVSRRPIPCVVTGQK